MNGSLRWAFNVKEWKPTKEQWKLCLRCVQKEEAEKCNRFCFVNDCKSSMVGRLLIRKAVSESLNLEYDKIILERTSSGKPFLTGAMRNKISFNVSHNGNFCVLASELHSSIGIDVMKIEYRGKKPVCEYFNIMKKQFSPDEWNFIMLPGPEREQLQRFFRLWCLKESYVKATGTGIAYDLQSLSFCCKTISLKQGVIITDTQLFKNDVPQTEWIFEEYLLNADHCVAVAIGNEENDKCLPVTDHCPKVFQEIDFNELTKKCIPFEKEIENFWDIFIAKSEKD